MSLKSIIEKNVVSADYASIDVNAMRHHGFHNEKIASVKKCCRKVDEGSGWHDVTSCPVCGSERRTPLMSKCGVDIVQCQQCTLGYGARIPKNASDVYSDRQYLGQAQRDYEKNVVYRMERFAKERVAILRRWLGRKPEDCALLDIGCGTGWFLEVARKEGFKTYGQELGSMLAAYAAQRLGIDVWACPVAEIDQGGLFDAITMFDVLEHTADPADMLGNIHRLLKPGGIVLIFVPNLHSIGFAVLQEESALVAPAEHLLYFTKTSMKHLAEKEGLEFLHLETKGMDLPDLIAYCRDRRNNAELAEFLTECSDVLQSAIDEAGRANHMRVVLRKPVP